MMRAVVGVIGHVDHGKTALVRALTGVDTDRLAEEKRRGISIVLGFAHLVVPGGVVDLVDMPGHERFVRTMVSGATGMDAALVVVAANEGVKPQTLEHLDIAGLLGVRRAIVAVSKAELASGERGAAVAAEVAVLAAAAGMEVLGAVLTSVGTGDGLVALRDLLAALPGEAGEDDGFAYLPIDRVFSVAGHGTVVTGTLRRGALRVSDEVALTPGARAVRLRGLQVHGARVTVAQPGQRVAANLRDVAADQVGRGAALMGRGMLGEGTWLTVALRLVGTEGMANGARVVVLFGTEEMEARVRLLDREVLLAGETGLAQLHCARAVSVPGRERFVLRRASPPLTIGGGRVIDPAAARLRRGAPEVLRRLAEVAGAGAAEIVRAELDAAGAIGVALRRLARVAGVSPARAVELAGDATMGRSGMVVTRAAFGRVVAGVSEALAERERVGREEAARLLPWAGPGVVEDALAELVRGGRVLLEGGAVRLHVPARERERAAVEVAVLRDLTEALRRGGLTPPDPGVGSKRLVDRLVREGVAVRTHDVVQKREILFHVEAVEGAKRRLAPLLGPPGLLVGEAGAALGISRKFCVPLLEYLDAIRFTRRVADRRILVQA